MASGKAYLEHVRRVHFSLVVVALGLALTILLSRPAEISRAISDLEKIQRIESLWNGRWLTEYAFTRYPELQSVSHLPTRARLKLKYFIDVHEVPVRLEIQPGVVDRSSTGELGVSSLFGLPFKTTLADFRRLWDDLGESLDLLSPSEGSPIGSEIEVVLWDSEGDQDIAAIVRGEIVEASDAEYAGDTSVLRLTFTHNPVPYRMSDAGVPSIGGTDPFLTANVTRWNAADDRWISTLLGDDAPQFGEVLISIQSYRTQLIHGQAALGDFYAVDFERYGLFAEAFRELDAFTSEIQDVELERLARVLENEQKRTSESFQAFGLKVPTPELSRWGSPLLVVIQLYFLLHLNALANVVAASERRSAPWIGIYNNWLSQSATVTSTVVLPLAVIVMLQWDAWPSRSLGWMWNGTLVAASTALAAFTAAALHKLHRESAS